MIPLHATTAMFFAAIFLAWGLILTLLSMLNGAIEYSGLFLMVLAGVFSLFASAAVRYHFRPNMVGQKKGKQGGESRTTEDGGA